MKGQLLQSGSVFLVFSKEKYTKKVVEVVGDELTACETRGNDSDSEQKVVEKWLESGMKVV